MAKLRSIHGELLSQEFTLGKEPLVIGRRERNDIVLTHIKVSRNHTSVGVRQGVAFVKDLKSANGTLLNGMKLQPGQTRTLQPGDEIRIAGTILRYFDQDTDLPEFQIPKHKLLGVIAEGGMGVVYRARQTSMERDVAIKVLNQKFAKRKEFVGRFVQEARSAGKLNHPNIVQVHDVGKAGAGYYYFTMELIEGADLAQLLGEPEGIDVVTAVNACARVADALEYAHERGIIHRDIKPDNIMIAKSGEVKLADLGIAKTAEAYEDSGKAKRVLGTPHYMSPEQASGRPVDGRSDLYSLGATLYHLLAGLPVFDAENSTEVMTQHVRAEPPPLREIVPHLSTSVCRVVDRLLQKDPQDRFQTAGEARDALDKTLRGLKRSGGVTTDSAKPVPGKVPVSVKRHPTSVNSPRRAASRAEPNPLELLANGWIRLGIFIIALALGSILFSIFGPRVERTIHLKNKINPRIERAEKLFGNNNKLTEARDAFNDLLTDVSDSRVREYAEIRIAQINRKIRRKRQRKAVLNQWSAYTRDKINNPNDFANLNKQLLSIRAAFPDSAKRVDRELDDIYRVGTLALRRLKREVDRLAEKEKIKEAIEKLDAFPGEYPGYPAEDVLAALRDRILVKGSESFSAFATRVQKYVAEERYGRALVACEDYEKQAIAGGNGTEFKTMRDKIIATTTNYAKKMTAESQAALVGLNFLLAKSVLSKYHPYLIRTPQEAEHKRLIKLVSGLEGLQARLVEAIKASQGRALPTGFSSPNIKKSARIRGADSDAVTMGKKKEWQRVKWQDRKALLADDVLRLLKQYLPPGDEADDAYIEKYAKLIGQ